MADNQASSTHAQQRPVLTLGVVSDPEGGFDARGNFGSFLRNELTERYPGVEWELSVTAGTLAAGDSDTIDVLEAARDVKLEKEWDFAIVLTRAVILDGREPALTQVSPVHGVGLVALPDSTEGALESVYSAGTDDPVVLAGTVAQVPGVLLGWNPEDGREDFVRRARQTSIAREERAGGNTASFAGRILLKNLGLLSALILATRPWKLAVTLSRAMTAAAATGVITLITTDLWLLATAYSTVKLLALALASIGIVAATLIIGAELWERPRSRKERGRVALFNIATTVSVSIGVLTFHLALFALSWTAALVLVDSGVFSTVIAAPVGMVQYAQLGLFTAVLATVGGALGAGLENDDVVRAAAFTRSNVTRRESAGIDGKR